MADDNKDKTTDDKSTHEHLREKPKAISKATFDEATGTLTLKLASEEELAENDRLLAMENDQGTIKE